MESLREQVAADVGLSASEVVLGGQAAILLDGAALSADAIGPETSIVAARRLRGGADDEACSEQSSESDVDVGAEGPAADEEDLEPMGVAPELQAGPRFVVVDQCGRVFAPRGPGRGCFLSDLDFKRGGGGRGHGCVRGAAPA